MSIIINSSVQNAIEPIEDMKFLMNLINYFGKILVGNSILFWKNKNLIVKEEK